MTWDVLLVLLNPHKTLRLAGQEHGRAIPLSDITRCSKTRTSASAPTFHTGRVPRFDKKMLTWPPPDLYDSRGPPRGGTGDWRQIHGTKRQRTKEQRTKGQIGVVERGLLCHPRPDMGDSGSRSRTLPSR